MPANCGKKQMRKKTGLEISPNVEEQDALASVVGCICFPGWTLNCLGLTQGEGFHPCVFRAQPAPGTELVHSQSWSDSEGKERYVTGEEMREKEMR